jgi:acid-sensing ion channel, other
LKNQRNNDTNWSLEKGYNSKISDVYPRRPSGWGENGGLKFEILREIDEIMENEDVTKGFKIAFHLPCEIPHFNKHFYRVPLQKSATLIITPSLIDTNSLESFSPKKRQCYYEGERKLYFFKTYTMSNCQIECLVASTYEKCKCVHFSLPRNDSHVTCSYNQSMSCFKTATRELMIENMNHSLNTSKSFDDQGELACECLPSCTSIKYESEVSYDEIRNLKKAKEKLKNNEFM